jgi:hypothetical protein
MSRNVRILSLLLALSFASVGGPLLGQQKPQWLPGQIGLNAGVLPSPGITYVNMAIEYSAGRFNGPAGNPIPDGLVSGNYTVWADENIFYYVPDVDILGGNLGFMLVLTPVDGYLTADILPNLSTLTAAAGATGLTDTWVQPFTLGWHRPRVDFQVAEAVVAPTGRYNPGASDNLGSGYFGNHVQTGTTVYITKNKGTSANLFTDWEVHGARQGINGADKTPGQAFTDEWGLGQVLPLKKNMSQLLQVGGVGYDQWEVTKDSGTISIPGMNQIVNANFVPSYSVHAAGVQANYILPAKEISAFFKYYREYKAYSHFQGNTIVFGGTYTFRIPKPPAHKP